MDKYDVAIIGAGPSGMYSALSLLESGLKVLMIDRGNSLEKRICPIIKNKAKSCINCTSCAIMDGFGGAGAFSDGKYNITNEFGGNLWEKIGKEKALELMEEIDDINVSYLSNPPKLYDSNNTPLKDEFLKKDLHLLNAKIRHLGTDNNYLLLEAIWNKLNESPNFDCLFNTDVKDLSYNESESLYEVITSKETISAKYCIVAVGRSGSYWMGKLCKKLEIPTISNRVDLGVRVELPTGIFKEITDQVYESKIVYRTKTYEDKVRTFCMNPNGIVVNENTNGIITVNGHSYEDKEHKTDNINFALLVEQTLTEPFKSSAEYGQSIARLSNMLGGGLIVQRFGDLIRGRRSTKSRMDSSTVRPTLKACPGDLSLVIPKRILDDIIEMIYQLDKIAPGTANDDTLLYGIEVKFYNMVASVTEKLEAENYKNLFIIGDGSGLTHSLSQSAASGLFVGKEIANRE